MNITEYLESLGNTADAVAQSLRAQGVKGIKRSLRYCPILNGIYKACPDYWPGLKIIGGPVSYYATLQDDQIMDPELPGPVVSFIEGFDLGHYEDMEVAHVKELVTRVYA